MAEGSGPSEHHRGRFRSRWVVGAVAVVGLLLVGGFFGIGTPKPTFSAFGGSFASRGPSLNVTCNPVNPIALNSSPSSLYVPALNPNVTLKPGYILSSSYQFEVANFTTADLGVEIEMPALTNAFPTGAGHFTLSRAASNYVITGPGWTNPLRGTVKKTIHTSTVFLANQNATLSSAKLAVMANASYGTLTLEFRWHWAYGPTGGKLTSGPWTLPNASFIKHTPYLPSIFMPAPFVGYSTRPASTALVGQTLVVPLDGYVSSAAFRMVLEYPGNGTEIQSIREYTPANITLFNATIPMIAPGNWFFPGQYLVHVHDECEAIDHSFTVTVAYPTNATVNFSISGPSKCGPIVFNNTTYTNNTSLVLHPSSTLYNLSVAKCRNQKFVSWNDSGGVLLQQFRNLTTRVMVSASGTISARFV